VLGVGCCFTAEESFNIKLIKNRFIEFVKKYYANKVSVVVFKDFDEEKDEYCNFEKISI